ncbi:MAG: small subunit ribosomal protein [Chloroflexota bacterium]|jgi:small subunit ribosomal protein S8|nr:small subunit ribosomal protein [Chloroflexota bacterium]
MLTDPIADMLTRIRNAVRARHPFVEMPSSRMKVSIAEVLREEGFIRGFDIVGGGPKKKLRVLLAYSPDREPRVLGLKRISKPGLRVYVGHDRIPRVYGGVGVAVVSTPRGIMTGDRARRENVGGELLAYVW